MGYGVHTSPDRLQNTESSPPSPPSLGGTRFQSPPSLGGTRFQSASNLGEDFQSPPELGDLGGKNLRDETQETYVYTVANFGGKKSNC
ncbi:MAG: hypothetical protein QNJ53_24645 [Pleurocapsa sp. MO_192.B19]|nr:hypothetical protein [Pleurocapsa sp. MO_192.B19]